MEASMKLAIGFGLALILAAPLAAKAQSQEEQGACIGDAFAVCGHAIPDRNRVAACLADNVDRISPGCRAVMARYPKPANPERRLTEDRHHQRHGYQPRYSYDRPYGYDRQYGDPRWRRDEPGNWQEPRYRRMQ
jgi:hypothetical protein